MSSKALFLVAVALAAVSTVVCNTSGKTLEGYKFGADVQKYVDWAKDACDIADLMSGSTPDFATAQKYYTDSNPKNNAGGQRTGYVKSLQAFAQYDFSGEKYNNIYSTWFDKDSAWTDTFIGQDFRQTGDFAAIGSRGRAEGIEKATTDSIMVSMVLHELDTAVNKVSQQSLSDNDGAPEAVDEAFAVYAGNPTCTLFKLANTYAPIFGTIKDCETNSSIINYNVVSAFTTARTAAKAGNSATLQTAIEEIVRGIMSSHIQAVLKYAVELDNALAAGQDTEGAQAEGYMYYRAIAPLVATASPATAAAIYKLLDLPNVPKVGTNFYLKIKAAFESVYKTYGIRASDIGTYGVTTATSSCPKKTNAAPSVSPSWALAGAIIGAMALFL